MPLGIAQPYLDSHAMPSDIQTARLRLEPLCEKHADIVFEDLCDLRIYRFIADEPPESRDALHKRYRFLQAGRSPDGSEHWLNWIAYRRDTERPVGCFQASIRPGHPSSVAYIVFPKYWRRGYAREAMTFLGRYLFATYDIPVLVAEMDTRNEASVGLVSALGFQHTMTNLDAAFFHGETSHEYRYELERAVVPRSN